MRLLSVIALIGVVAASLTTAQAEPTKIRVAWVVVPNNLPPILFAEPGIARHQGQSYTMDAIHFSGTPQMISAFGANEIDIALLAYSSLAVAIENAGMSDLRVIADAFQDGAPGYYTDEYMVLKDSPAASKISRAGFSARTSPAARSMSASAPCWPSVSSMRRRM
jgi:NitT/TauT family transport system substrate-binding protein